MELLLLSILRALSGWGLGGSGLSLGGEWGGTQGSVWMGNEGLGINLGEGVSQGSVWVGDGELRAQSGWGLGG